MAVDGGHGRRVPSPARRELPVVDAFGFNPGTGCPAVAGPLSLNHDSTRSSAPMPAAQNRSGSTPSFMSAFAKSSAQHVAAHDSGMRPESPYLARGSAPRRTSSAAMRTSL